MPTNNVVSLSKHRNRETAALVQFLMDEVQAGNLDGLVVQSMDRRGAERAFTTGTYKRDPEAAVSACLKISMRMTMMSGVAPG